MWHRCTRRACRMDTACALHAARCGARSLVWTMGRKMDPHNESAQKPTEANTLYHDPSQSSLAAPSAPQHGLYRERRCVPCAIAHRLYRKRRATPPTPHSVQRTSHASVLPTQILIRTRCNPRHGGIRSPARRRQVSVVPSSLLSVDSPGFPPRTLRATPTPQVKVG